MANLTAINPNAIDDAAAIASNAHMAVSSGGQFTVLLSGLLLVRIASFNTYPTTAIIRSQKLGRARRVVNRVSTAHKSA
jgi:hypothetical protein